VQLTIPDLVVLSLLAEGPRHGYDLNAELERRDVRDWAGISRPQVYYSLKKLNEFGLIRRREAPKESGQGPDRQVYELAPAARPAVAARLADEDWAKQRIPPPFLTWLALSWLADPPAAQRMVALRRDYLRQEIARERATLAAIREELGPAPTAPALMVDLTIRQFEEELAWLSEIEPLLDAS
jgi:DNA-binding PadR family transcriptional regulator